MGAIAQTEWEMPAGPSFRKSNCVTKGSLQHSIGLKATPYMQDSPAKAQRMVTITKYAYEQYFLHAAEQTALKYSENMMMTTKKFTTSLKLPRVY